MPLPSPLLDQKLRGSPVQTPGLCVLSSVASPGPYLADGCLTPPESVSLLVWPCLFILGKRGSPSLAPHLIRTCQLEERLHKRLIGSLPQLVPGLPSIPLVWFPPPSPVTSPWLNTKDTFSHLDFLFLDLRLPLDLLPSLALSASCWVSSHLPGCSALLADSLLGSLRCRCLFARLPGGGGGIVSLFYTRSLIGHLMSWVPFTPSS